VAGTLTGWPSKLDDHKPFLHQRWNSGCTNISQLHREITARGYRGSYATVYAYLRPFKGLAAPPAVPAPPKVRHITRWILRDPATLDDDEQASLTSIRAQCPHLDALASHVTEFAKILTGRRGEQPDAWIARASAGDQPDLRSFTTGLNRDYQAVLNGLTPALQLRQGRRQRQPDHSVECSFVAVHRICVTWESSQVRTTFGRQCLSALGFHVTNKMLKRQMYGRARFGLLRKRVLLA
jgi:hypothetical protein